MGKKITGASITLPAPFNATSSDPVDSRFVVETKSDLINKETFGFSGNYCYIYEGMPVYVSDEKAVYTYMGPFDAGNGVPIEGGMDTLDNWVRTGDKDFNINIIQNSIKDTNDALTAEINRAKAAEKEVADNLAAEITRATGKENELKNSIDTANTAITNEVKRSTEKDAELTKDLSDEVARAIEVESTKADIVDLSNVIGEEAVGDDILESIETITIDLLKKESFIDMWNNICGQFGLYNTETKYFELNGLTDITYAQALQIYPYLILGKRTDKKHFANCKARALVLDYNTETAYDLDMLIYISDVEAIRFNATHSSVWYITGALNSTFDYCRKLKSILGFIRVNSSTNNTFRGCGALREVRLILSNSVNLSWSPLLSFDSVKYMIYNAGDLSITITFHPDVYSKITDPDNAEWYPLLAKAEAKNISIATV